jgi:hypothetical protein
MEGERMIFMIKYQTKKDTGDPNSHFTRSFFAEHPSDPAREMVTKLIGSVSNGDFEESSIEIEEWLNVDLEEMKKLGTPVHKFS